jgi:hypothetical protein
MLDSLNKINSMYTDKYLTLGSSQSIYTPQKQKLENTLHSIEKQIDAKNDIISTYDRELQDRNNIRRPFTFWTLRGISTLQDWVLLCFFFIYSLICLFIMFLSLNTTYPFYSLFVTLLCSIVVGVIIMGTIVRFA